MPYKEIEQKKEGQAKPMCSPFECEEVGHLQPVARSSVPHDSQNMKGRDGARDVLVILVIVAVFAGALVFILSRKRGSAAFGSSQGTLEGLAANSMNEQEQNKIVVLCGFRGSEA